MIMTMMGGLVTVLNKDLIIKTMEDGGTIIVGLLISILNIILVSI